ncbi:MAG: adenylosuccinate synthase [Pseudomonas sp.]
MAVVNLGTFPELPNVGRKLKQSEHARLCDLAVSWLRRPNSSRGHGCLFAVSEIATGHGVEVPDAIGWRLDAQAQSIVVEVKVSRADFLADANKPHRKDPTSGMGTWRYYMCPEGLIQVEDLPPRWGLLWVKGRTVRPVHGPAAFLRAQDGYINYRVFSEQLSAFAFPQTNRETEQMLMVRLLARVGDPEQLNRKIRDGFQRAQYLEQEVHRLREECRALNSQLWLSQRTQDGEQGAC